MDKQSAKAALFEALLAWLPGVKMRLSISRQECLERLASRIGHNAEQPRDTDRLLGHVEDERIVLGVFMATDEESADAMEAWSFPGTLLCGKVALHAKIEETSEGTLLTGKFAYAPFLRVASTTSRWN